MKKIKWKKVKGGRAFEHMLEGYVDNKLAFMISGSLCVTDLRESKASLETDKYIHPKHYHMEGKENKKEEAKQIAFDLLNGLNVKKHEANLERQRIKDEYTQKVIREAQEFLDNLKNK